MNDVKADAVLFLTRDGSTELDRSAAKLFARCEIEVIPVQPADRGRAPVDIVIHGSPARIAGLHHSDAAGRVENAVHHACDREIRTLQWVEERGTGPDHADGGEPPKYRNDQPNDRLKRDKHERHIPGMADR